ncbi:hypothetical protein G3578_07495 [Brevibacillus sp. SYP-B805]|uniref:hypothetical protein n=1 Tax=Brevibacillus sp. SYP-B805 TaxID=1578199 RepID=UPI0013EBE1E5|nr:hypothetical protein [Brevibacillus sp. SYP-B805]NGQ95029.1 hypothetical protein [Brevibacillus sp. SYP-B805]
MVEVLKMPKYPCSFCKKKEATQFCDFVIGYAWTSAKEKGKMIGGYHVTCDNEICKDCATTAPGGFDFCPSCNELRRMIEEKHDKRPGKLMAAIAFGSHEDS